MIWPWQRERRARRAALAALGASVDDDRLDPDVILATAKAKYERLVPAWRGDDVAELRRHFAPSDIVRLLALRPLRPAVDYLDKAEPREISISLADRARFSLVDFREATGAGSAEASVLVRTRARSWSAESTYRSAQAAALRKQLLPGPGEAIKGSGTPYPQTRSDRIRAIWVFRLPPVGAWEFVRSESWVSGSYRLGTSLDQAERTQVDIRDDVLLAEAAADRVGLKIPLEIAENLPYDAKAALLELAGVSERFDPNVIEAAVREILDCWAEGSDGAPERLAACAGEDAAAQLLTPPGVVLRGPELLRIEPRRVRALRVPPEVTLEIDVRAYLGDPELDDGIRRERKLWWRLAADDSALPWRLVDAQVNPFRP